MLKKKINWCTTKNKVLLATQRHPGTQTHRHTYL